MKITILSDNTSWINDFIPQFIAHISECGHTLVWVHGVEEIVDGDLAFFLGCGQYVSPAILLRNRHNLVVHESALPLGRGWSPLTWQILDGINEIPIVLFEATDKIDSGVIYLEETMQFSGLELIDELRKIQAETSLRMCREFIANYPGIIFKGREQRGEPTYFPQRTPKDSRLDPDLKIIDQFNLLRVVDNERYPAYFEYAGEKYVISIHKNKIPIKES